MLMQPLNNTDETTAARNHPERVSDVVQVTLRDRTTADSLTLTEDALAAFTLSFIGRKSGRKICASPREAPSPANAR